MIALPARALIIRQPWAGLVASGLKVNAAGETVEFRNRPTRIRETVAVYAGRSYTRRVPLWDGKTVPEYGLGPGRTLYVLRGNRRAEVMRNFPDSAASSIHEECVILCVATISDCREVGPEDLRTPGCPSPASDEWERTFAWVFTDLHALPEPVPCKPPRGAQTWFRIDAETRNLIAPKVEGDR